MSANVQLGVALCSMQRVRCVVRDIRRDKTEFLDASGKVIASGDDASLEICYQAGPKKGQCSKKPDGV